MKSFAALLDMLNEASAEQQPMVEQLIRNAFQVSKAVLVLDMSGFTLTARRDGILRYLCLVRLMQKLTQPIVQRHGGQLVKHEADNLLAVFDDPTEAVTAAFEMHQASAKSTAGGVDLAFSIGIDFGEFLLIDGNDCFGDPVNLAHKLGEDIARPGEVLVSAAVHERLANGKFECREVTLSISGLEVQGFSVLSLAAT